MHKCNNPVCNNFTNNSKYCNRSCAATCTNKLFVKRKAKLFTCQVCGIKLSYRRKYCDEHNPQKVDWSSRTIGDIVTNYAKNHRQHRYSIARSQAKYVYEHSNRPKCCEKCGYDLFYEICHVVPIHMFPSETPITTVNSLNNLIALCPNCHWELDNGLYRP